MTDFHQPVLVETVTDYLLDTKGDKFLDLTLGSGGYFIRLLQKTKKKLTLYGIDRDPEAIKRATSRLSPFENVNIIYGNHSDLEMIAQEEKIPGLDGIIGDWGISRELLENPDRGFAHKFEGPLDMRYSPDDPTTAADLLNTLPQDDLAAIIKKYGEERFAKPIAREIVKNRPLTKSSELSSIVHKVCPGKYEIKSLSRVYMALRVFLNEELDAIDNAMAAALKLLRVGGVLICLSYDSTEDKKVKRFFSHWSKKCHCPPEFPVCVCDTKPKLLVLTPKVITPGEAEIGENPYARSAKLRAAKKM